METTCKQFTIIFVGNLQYQGREYIKNLLSAIMSFCSRNALRNIIL